MSQQTEYRKDIQVLRGLAVAAVVLFHTNEKLFPKGYLGVDIFFVISGFVVTPLILRIFEGEPDSFTKISKLKLFYARRFYRLAPALALTLIISTFVIFLFGTPADHYRFSRQGIATVLILGNFGAYKYSGNYFSPNPNPLIHTWSLSVEEQIYLVLPIFLLLFLHNVRSIKKISIIVFSIITILSLISFSTPSILQPIYSRFGIQIASQFSFYSPIDRIWQFTLGGLTYFFYRKYGERLRDSLNFKTYIFLSCFIFILSSHFPSNLEINSILISFLSVLILLYRSLMVIPSNLSHKLEWLGDRSYSIYLVHMPLLYIAKYSPFIIDSQKFIKFLALLISVIFSIFLGSASFVQVENRYRYIYKNATSRKPFLVFMILFTFIIPFSLFFAMSVGIQNKYWGLDRTEPQPSYAGQLDPNCERDTYNGGPCIYDHKGASRSYLLIGDSHAGMLSESFIRASEVNGARAIIWTHSACPFQLVPANNLSDHCLKTNKRMYAYIKRHKPDAVLISERILTNYDLKPIRDAILGLKSFSSNVTLVGSTPEFPDSGRFMKPMPIFSAPYSAPKEFKLSSMEIAPFQISKRMEEWAKREGVGFVSLTSIFCNNSICTRWNPSGWLYRDSDHFSTLGANLAIPVISDWMSKLRK